MRHLKEEFDKLTFKEALVYTLATVAMVAGITMLYLGMYLPPSGQIHESVLTAFGIICVFTASLLGISMHYANELNKFKSNVNELLAELAKKGVTS